MNDKEAYEAWVSDQHKNSGPLRGIILKPEEVWHAAIAWLRLQGEPSMWVFVFEDGEMSNDVFDSESRAQTWVDSDDCMWAGHIAPLFLAPQPAIPDGWQIVPKQPTPGMLKAAYTRDRDGTTPLYYKVWESMLAAAPEPSK